MSKKTMIFIVDLIMWNLILLLPLIIYAVMCVNGQPHFDSILTDTFGVMTSGVIHDTIKELFGTNGVLPLFSNNSGIMSYFVYFVNVNLIHLMIDFILFIPNLCHKWLNKFLGGIYD